MLRRFASRCRGACPHAQIKQLRLRQPPLHRQPLGSTVLAGGHRHSNSYSTNFQLENQNSNLVDLSNALRDRRGLCANRRGRPNHAPAPAFTWFRRGKRAGEVAEIHLPDASRSRDRSSGRVSEMRDDTCSYQRQKQTPNAQRPTPNVEVRTCIT